MPDYVFPSKLVSEKIELFFDFTDELAWGEGFFSWSCTVETLVGTDDSPQDMLAGSAAPVQYSIKQKFYKGTPGVIYNLICDVIGTTGAHYRKVGKLAVLPDAALNPPFYATFYTTGPYPVDAIEGAQTHIGFVSGKLTPQPFPLDKAQVNIAYLSGDLFGGSEAFTAHVEAVTSSLAFQAGDLFGEAEAFSVRPEGISTGIVLMSGDLFGSALAYTPFPEKVQTSLSFISGTLT